jgi:hypothetical protein
VGIFGDLLEETGLSGLLSTGKWITLKNGKRLKVDNDGRIVAGLPSRYHGTHVRDLSALTHQERELQGIDCEDLRTHCHTCRKTFRSKDEAFLALMEANPDLHQLQQSEAGAYDLAFLKWNRNGRRGPKPTTPITDGRLDAINEYFNLRGKNRVGSFTEAIYYVIPKSRRWADLDVDQLGPLSEAAGMTINPPTQAMQQHAGQLSVEECERDVDRRIADMFERAKSGRLPPPASAADDGRAPPGERSDDRGRDEVPF